MDNHRYAVIMAGGKGTRFWPLSRAHHPKQLLKISGKRSLLRETADRILPLSGLKKTLVVTVEEHHRAVRKELPLLPNENFLVEPQGKNTAPCIGLAATELARRDPNAIMVLLPADHWISDLRSFSRTIKAAMKLAERNAALVTIGIRPGYPETGYGYILRGKKIKGPAGLSVYQVEGFKEKPTVKKARQLIRSGSLWNSGIFVWRISTILEMLRRFSRGIYDGTQRIRVAAKKSSLGTPAPRLRSILRREYRKMPSISIDYAVLEKAGAEGKVLTVEAQFGWSDLGNWAAVHRMLPQDRGGNVAIGKWLGVKTKNCLIYSPDRLVTLLGIQDIVVVDTPDALLVADLKRSQEVRDLVEELHRRGYGRYTV